MDIKRTFFTQWKLYSLFNFIHRTSTFTYVHIRKYYIGRYYIRNVNYQPSYIIYNNVARVIKEIYNYKFLFFLSPSSSFCDINIIYVYIYRYVYVYIKKFLISISISIFRFISLNLSFYHRILFFIFSILFNYFLFFIESFLISLIFPKLKLAYQRHLKRNKEIFIFKSPPCYSIVSIYLKVNIYLR